jgi:hypothetical protein
MMFESVTQIFKLDGVPAVVVISIVLEPKSPAVAFALAELLALTRNGPTTTPPGAVLNRTGLPLGVGPAMKQAPPQAAPLASAPICKIAALAPVAQSPRLATATAASPVFSFVFVMECTPREQPVKLNLKLGWIPMVTAKLLSLSERVNVKILDKYQNGSQDWRGAATQTAMACNLVRPMAYEQLALTVFSPEARHGPRSAL